VKTQNTAVRAGWQAICALECAVLRNLMWQALKSTDKLRLDEANGSENSAD
jgi:hypothetical protein